MNKQNLNLFSKENHKCPSILLVGMASALAVVLSATPKANALYILSGVEDTAIILDGSKQAPAISSQLIDVASNRSGYDVNLKAGQHVKVTYQGSTVTSTSKNETVASLLQRLGITPGPLDMVAVNVAEEQVDLTVASDITLYDQVTEPAPFETIRRPNPQMKQGEEKVVQEGVDGVRTSVYEVVWSNGEMISRQFVEELDSTAQDKIIEYGTAVDRPIISNSTGTTENIHSPIANVTKNADGSGTLTLATGEVLPFTSVKSMKATAYTAGYDGVGTRTATGTHVRRGTVAVDKRVVPLGTRMYIVTADGSYVYGLSVAEDTGYVGNNLDLYHDTYQQCINFGRRGVTVYFLA